MKKVLVLASMLSVLGLSVPIDFSFAGNETNKQVVQGKAKGVANKEKSISKKTRKKIAYKKPRYAKNVNRPQEGENLKLEGMIKDLNEQ